MNVWHVVKWAALVVLMLALTMVLARLFAGEDSWERAPDGRWVAHGHPAGPPPGPEYQTPWPERVIPWVLLAAFASGLLAAAVFASRVPASRESIDRSLRFAGGVSVISAFIAGALLLALLVTFAAGLGAGWEEPLAEVALLLALLGAAAFLGLLSIHAYGVKRILEAHYDLKRTGQLLQDALERLATGPMTGSAPRVDSPSPPAV
ncbi:MAG: hypothetical protein MUQ65_10290 [Armatimonadetes bacterium]|nr:hypothetical protein [Armatimonadota bacterium]